MTFYPHGQPGSIPGRSIGRLTGEPWGSTLQPDGPEAHLLGCPDNGRFLSRHPQGSQPVAGPSGLPFAAIASPPSGLTVPGFEVAPGAVAAPPFMNPKLKQVFCLCGLFCLAVILAGIKTGTTGAALLAVLLLVAITALLGCWLWLILPESDRAEMGVASRDNYENHGSE